MTLLTVSAAWPLFADGFSAQITSVPSPAVTNKALEVRIETQDMGSEVYCYTWCKDLNGTEKAPWTWEGVNTDKFRMSGSGGTYTLSIPDIKAFYGLTDQELTGLKKLGFQESQVYTTMELRMKCAIGKCGRCNIGNKYVCKDGPVFRFDQLAELPDEY